MPRSFTNIIVHMVFSTKHRLPFLQQPLRERAHAYIATLVREKGVFASE